MLHSSRQIVLLCCTLVSTSGLTSVAEVARHELDDPSSPVHWIWSGGLTATSMEVVARVDEGTDPLTLDLTIRGDEQAAARFEPKSFDRRTGLARFSLSNLEPARAYHYALTLGDPIDDAPLGSFRTPSLGPQSFTIAIGACARTASSHPVFDTIRQHAPLFFLHLGDFHYENVARREPWPHIQALEKSLTAPAQARLYASIPVAYIWDDHDFVGNNSNGRSRARMGARTAYQLAVPHYPLAAGRGDVAIYQSFVIGRVLFILTDSRSERTPHRARDSPSKTMLGEKQKRWFKRTIEESGEQALIVWANSLPWIGAARSRSDSWAGYDHERRELASWIRRYARGRLVMVSGDAHMLAIDDGSHNRYGGDPVAGFPILQAGALDQEGSVKGGPYSEGTFPGGGQFGLLIVEDDGGSRLTVHLSGRNALDEELVRYSFEVEATPFASP